MFPRVQCSLNHWPGYKLVWEYIPHPPQPHCLSSSPGDFNYCQPQTGCSLNHLKCKAGITVGHIRKSKEMLLLFLQAGEGGPFFYYGERSF